MDQKYLMASQVMRAKYLAVVVKVDFESSEGTRTPREIEAFNVSDKDENEFFFFVDIDTGLITGGWNLQEDSTFHWKIKSGSYKLLDAQYKVFGKFSESCVPNVLIPIRADVMRNWILLEVDSSGFIKGWDAKKLTSQFWKPCKPKRNIPENLTHLRQQNQELFEALKKLRNAVINPMCALAVAADRSGDDTFRAERIALGEAIKAADEVIAGRLP